MTEEIYNLVLQKVQHGWMMKEKCAWFERIYSSLLHQGQPVVSVEIGVWYGMSLVAQGLMAKELMPTTCKVYGIDPWTPEAALEGVNAKSNEDWWKERDYRDPMDRLLINIHTLGLTGIVGLLPMRSEDAASLFTEIDVLHIDGNHSEEKSTLDVSLYEPKVKKGGWIIADDTVWDTVHKAELMLDERCTLLEKFIKDGQGFSVYQKK